ncbi:ATP-dependent DNA ligase [Streptomyces liliiviolaceus]|uniref:ATP-dependent DNA ligase n=1 Tax=Streptomyces liliiviolaceus TaxID=2823109 RepID=UPI001FFD513D|nr:hypothetical protein [Streptomyces liliiviolaceus]
MRLAGTDTTAWTYERRRAAPVELFRAHRLAAAWALCPSTTDPATVHEWLTTCTTVGMEGVVFKRLDGPYRPTARGWLKYKVRETTEAIVCAVTGPTTAPRTLLLGRYDTIGRLQYTGRTTPCPERRPASSVVYSPPRAPNIRGQAGRSPPSGAHARRWTSRRSGPNWSWKSASMSPATPPAGGATPPAGTVPGLTLRPTTSHSSTTPGKCHRSGLYTDVLTGTHQQQPSHKHVTTSPALRLKHKTRLAAWSLHPAPLK